jgi:serine/threonine-protein kinase HipA
MKTIYVHINFGGKSIEAGELFASGDLGRHVFSYDPQFIASGLQISPFYLPLGGNSFAAPKNDGFYDLHGVFADSLPDTWGRRVQDAEFLKIGVIEPTALERLAFIGQNGIGALRYHPAREFPKGDEIVRLATLRKATQRIINGDIDDVSEQLLKSGGSAGGARPKFLVDIREDNPRKIRYTHGSYDDGYTPVILKVPSFAHDHYQRIEYAYTQIARDAGIDVPDCYLIDDGKSKLAFFAMKRFDIMPDGSRYHAHTLAGLLNADYRETTPDAATFLRTIDDLTRDHRQVVEGFRRVAFNYIGSNKDDHAKNFSFLMNSEGEWSLSPAYDIGFSKGQNNMHQMRLGQKSRGAEAKDFKALANDFDIPMWKDIVDKTLSAFEKWPDVADGCGVPEKYITAINQNLRENIKRIRNGLSKIDAFFQTSA